MEKKKNILICPLEWGLGHAGRMIPLAEKLREMNFNILFGAGEKHLAFLRHEAPGFEYVNFPGFSPRYSRSLPQYLTLILQIPSLIYHITGEHIRLKKIIKANSVDIVISDNRFGLWNRKVRTVYVTHQLLIPFPRHFSFLEFIGVCIHRQIIRKYSLCFIPDLPGDLNLTGRLSHGIILPPNARYTGILSRFDGVTESSGKAVTDSRHNTVILSGPEPQRGILEKKLADILELKEIPGIILGGRPDKDATMIRSGNIIYYNHLNRYAMKRIIEGSETIIARSGYTTVMELISLNCSALLIPTPGQTEQEYLATHLMHKGWFSSVSQKDLNETVMFPGIKPEWGDEIINQSRILLTKALKELSEEPEASDRSQ